MSAFRFRLQRVLDYQQQQCDLAQARVSACHGTLERSRLELASHSSACVAVRREVIHSDFPTAAQLSALAYFCIRAAKLELHYRTAIASAEQRLEQERLALVELQRRARLLEKLRDRKFEEHRYQEDLEAENQASDTYLATWNGASNGLFRSTRTGSQPTSGQ
jgi:flagellar export protein FliJ